MEQDNKENIINIYNRVVCNAKNIFNIISEYYGDENTELNITSCDEIINVIDIIPSNASDMSFVDFLNYFNKRAYIVVHFPEVRIENEYGYYTDTKDFWVKILLKYKKYDSTNESEENYNWFLDYEFKITRSTYQLSHLRSDYMHSHCPGIPILNGADSSDIWSNCCLGNGPIKRTCLTLCGDYDEAMWKLFCFELDGYIHTESVSGGPYRRLSSIISDKSKKVFSKKENTPICSLLPIFSASSTAAYKLSKMLMDFIPYYIKNENIKLCYTYPTWMFSENYFKTRVKITKEFISWFNTEDNPWNKIFNEEKLLSYEFLDGPFLLDNNSIYTVRSNQRYSDTQILRLKDKVLFKFKGKQIKVVIENDCDTSMNLVNLISRNVCSYIMTTIISFINMKYYE